MYFSGDKGKCALYALQKNSRPTCFEKLSASNLDDVMTHKFRDKIIGHHFPRIFVFTFIL